VLAVAESTLTTQSLTEQWTLAPDSAAFYNFAWGRGERVGGACADSGQSISVKIGAIAPKIKTDNSTIVDHLALPPM